MNSVTKIAFGVLFISSLALADFTRNHSKEVVTDTKTNLMWQDDASVKTTKKTWNEAVSYCDNLSFAGFSDWRLPSRMELLGITDKTKYDPAIKDGFLNVTADYYWSSSPSASVSSYAWVVYFKYGYDYWYYKSGSYLVRCVRDSSETLSFDFKKLVDTLIADELATIPKPPLELKLEKDEFETTKEFETRVKETKIRQEKEIVEYKRKYAGAQDNAKKNAIQKALEITWGKPLLGELKYDADNGYFIATITFEAKSDFRKTVALKVEKADARNFKESFATLKPKAIFDYTDGSVSLKDIVVPYQTKTYQAQFTDIRLEDTKVAVNLSKEFEMDKVATNITVGEDKTASFDTSKLVNYNEIANRLKDTKEAKKDSKKWLFVVGVEKYKYTDNIAYSKRSAEDFAKVAQKTLGINASNSYVLINDEATQAEIKTKLKTLARKVQEGDTIYFYYNGHGVPIPSQKNEPYILATDSNPDFIGDEEFFSLQNIYKSLSDSKASKVFAFVDSCFSGVTDGKAVLKGVAATRLKPKTIEFDKSKMVVITAGKDHQYSNGYDKKAQRLFSYVVMKNILDGKREITELFEKTKEETYDTSMTEFGDLRVQEPTMDGNGKLEL